MMGYHNTQTIKMQNTSIQRRIIFITICLLLTVVALVIISRSTMGALHTVQQRQNMVHRGDVNLIHQWMTIPYIAHQYHVPDQILYTALKLPNTTVNSHSTLQTIAIKQKKPVTTIIHTLQETILSYQKTHPRSPTSKIIVYRGENGRT
jgi:hypothetical protein